VEKFSILVLSDSLGSLTREVKPPANIESQTKNGLGFDLGFHKPQQMANYAKRARKFGKGKY